MNRVKPRILLADDHRLLMEGYGSLLRKNADVVGIAYDGRQLLKLAVELQPDLILLDISMPVLNGIDAARRLSSLVPKAKVLMVSMHSEPDYVAESLRAGAAGFVSKRDGWSELQRAIQEVLAGRRYITPSVTGQAATALATDGNAGDWKLTLRQREVLQLVAEGRTALEIGGLLGISSKTVEFHKARIMKQLGIRSVAGLTRYALQRGLLV